MTGTSSERSDDRQHRKIADPAQVYADAILMAVRQEYPNDLRHSMMGRDDRPTPRQLHPAFYGCYDWHSCVEMHWALIRLLRLVPDAFDQEAAYTTLAAHLTTVVPSLRVLRRSDVYEYNFEHCISCC